MTVTIRKDKRSKKGGWQIDIRLDLPDRTVIRERYKAKVTSKAGAEAAGKDREAFLIRNGLKTRQQLQADTQRESIKFKAFFHSFLEKRKLDDLAPSYLDWMEAVYKSRLAPVFDELSLNDITTEVVNDFRRLMRNPSEGERKPLGKKASNNLLGFLGTVFRSAVEQGKMKKVPELQTFKIVKEKIKIDGINCYNESHLDKLVEQARLMGSDVELVILLGADAGLRFGEILGVVPATDMTTVKDPKTGKERHNLTVARSIYRSKQVVHVKPPKNGKPRTVPMTPRLRAALAAKAQTAGYALQNTDGQALTTKQVRSWLRQAQKNAGLTATGRLHVLRHTFCSRLAMKGVPSKVIQALADHANITTTERYLHSDHDLEHLAINSLSPTPKPPADGATVEQKKLKLVSA